MTVGSPTAASNKQTTIGMSQGAIAPGGIPLHMRDKS